MLVLVTAVLEAQSFKNEGLNVFLLGKLNPPQRVSSHLRNNLALNKINSTVSPIKHYSISPFGEGKLCESPSPEQSAL